MGFSFQTLQRQSNLQGTALAPRFLLVGCVVGGGDQECVCVYGGGVGGDGGFLWGVWCVCSVCMCHGGYVVCGVVRGMYVVLGGTVGVA